MSAEAPVDIGDDQGKWFTIKHSAEANLDTISAQLINEARHDAYNLETRSRFVLAVGASALLMHHLPSDEPYIIVAENALRRHGPLALVEAADADLPYWTNVEWDTQLRQTAASVVFDTPELTGPVEHSVAGYVYTLDALLAGRAHFVKPSDEKL